MSNWENFEEICCLYLNEHYGNDHIKFIYKGKSDSTKPDIEVFIDNQYRFSIEVKMPKAQSGQFVVLLEKDKFIFSPKNKTSENNVTTIILNNLNYNFDNYKNVKSKALKININQNYFSDWIKNYYKTKKVKYVISKYKNKFIIFPLEKYDFYFKINGNIRRKKSGSRNLPDKNISQVEEFLKKILKINLTIEKKDKKKILTLTKYTEKIEDKEFELQDFKIYITKTDYNYVIKKLSETNNPTVIFSVTSIKSQDKKDLEIFKESLN